MATARSHPSPQPSGSPSTGVALPAVLPRGAAALVAAACGVAALLLAQQYPLGAVPATAAVLAVVLLARYFWTQWPGWMLGLIPVIGLAPWTGWWMLEELDLLVLASGAGGYLALSGPHRSTPPAALPAPRQPLRWHPGSLLLMGLLALWTAVSVVKGVQAGGGLPTHLYGGYQDSSAALHAGKPVLWVLLLLPLWARISRRSAHTLLPSLWVGLSLGLAGCAAGVVYERWAFTGLLNFSTDYRATGFFWETHVGGAALDGTLALLMPVALIGLFQWRSRIGFGWAAALLLVGGYATLVSFSRGLYLALAVSFPLALFLLWRQVQRAKAVQVLPAQAAVARPGFWRAAGVLGLLALAAGAAGAVMFPTSGYRGLLALGLCMLALLAQPAAQGRTVAQRGVAVALGLVMAAPLVALLALLATHVHRAAYASFALSAAASIGLGLLAARERAPWSTPMGDALRAGLWFSTLAGVGIVAWHWGGTAALQASLLPLGLLALAWPLTQGGAVGRVLQSADWRARGAAFLALLVLVGAVGALGGGRYVQERLSRTSADMVTRERHWSRVLTTVEREGGWAFGLGAGRFVPAFALEAPPDERIGDHRWLPDGEPRLRLSSGTHVLGFGEMYRISQRLDQAPPGLQLALKVRAEQAAELFVEVCEKHLMYGVGCVAATLKVPAQAGAWQTLRLPFKNLKPVGDHSPVFSMALAGRGQALEVAEVSLKDAEGAELLVNGDFRQGLARWLSSSDLHHLPWHAKSLLLHILVEQGLLGVGLASALVALALGRLTLGDARDHPLAPALSAALVGFLVVGLFDSLVDATRLAFLFLTLLVLALGLRHVVRKAA